MLRIRIPKAGFVEIAEEADAEGTYDESLLAIIRLLQKAARERDAMRTHLLTVSLHAFLYYKGGSYPLPTHTGAQTGARPSVAQAGPPSPAPAPQPSSEQQSQG